MFRIGGIIRDSAFKCTPATQREVNWTPLAIGSSESPCASCGLVSNVVNWMDTFVVKCVDLFSSSMTWLSWPAARSSALIGHRLIGDWGALWTFGQRGQLTRPAWLRPRTYRRIFNVSLFSICHIRRQRPDTLVGNRRIVIFGCGSASMKIPRLSPVSKTFEPWCLAELRPLHCERHRQFWFSSCREFPSLREIFEAPAASGCSGHEESMDFYSEADQRIVPHSSKPGRPFGRIQASRLQGPPPTRVYGSLYRIIGDDSIVEDNLVAVNRNSASLWKSCVLRMSISFKERGGAFKVCHQM